MGMMRRVVYVAHASIVDIVCIFAGDNAGPLSYKKCGLCAAWRRFNPSLAHQMNELFTKTISRTFHHRLSM